MLKQDTKQDQKVCKLRNYFFEADNLIKSVPNNATPRSSSDSLSEKSSEESVQ